MTNMQSIPVLQDKGRWLLVSETGQTRSKWWWSCLVTVPPGCARIWGQIKQLLQISPAAKWPLAPMCNRQGPRDTDTRWGSHQGFQRRGVPFASILLCNNTAWPIRFLLAVTQSNDALWGCLSDLQVSHLQSFLSTNLILVTNSMD
jgi:hypothetical protein